MEGTQTENENLYEITKWQKSQLLFFKKTISDINSAVFAPFTPDESRVFAFAMTCITYDVLCNILFNALKISVINYAVNTAPDIAFNTADIDPIWLSFILPAITTYIIFTGANIPSFFFMERRMNKYDVSNVIVGVGKIKELSLFLSLIAVAPLIGILLIFPAVSYISSIHYYASIGMYLLGLSLMYSEYSSITSNSHKYFEFKRNLGSIVAFIAKLIYAIAVIVTTIYILCPMLVLLATFFFHIVDFSLNQKIN
ncbi:hypothetical protein NEMIN01_1575 [Nematocida minor]|uniref:uncharacterized protein n=1 Tax=Nematocida minor TaxID=1912983 RepID=UPI0022209C8B|nr:uncharacterized protein NEMIN01_1575 [Nematocida minor]KAI5191591.1 hypothetical protein NEMIN01_1575 [Nematocida minor]